MTGLEAILFNRPLVVLNLTNKNYDQIIPYVSSKAAVKATNFKKLTSQLKTLTNPNHPQTKKQIKTAHQFASHYIKPPDGLVCQRITQLLLKQSSSRHQ